MDGILLDTEVLGQKIMTEVAARFGYEFTSEMYFLILGCNHNLTRTILLDHYGSAFPYEDVMQGFYDGFLDIARAGQLPLKKGLTECMEGLRARGIPCALATSTERDIVETYIKGTPEMQGIFTATVCGREVQQSKPEPDIYLEAARQLSLTPDECLGVEDSRNGLRSLRSAGCKSVMIPDLLPYDESFAGIVDYKLDDLTQLCPLIDRINLEAKIKG